MNVLTNDVFKSEQSKTRTALHEIRDALMGGESGVIYGFHIDSSESDPSSAVTYLRDAVGMTPAHMDFTNSKFLWGSWRDAFFHPRPCMLKSDGTVDYYLDPDDYSKKYDGTASDVVHLYQEFVCDDKVLHEGTHAQVQISILLRKDLQLDLHRFLRL